MANMANTPTRWQPFADLGELRSRFDRMLLCRVARPKATPTVPAGDYREGSR